MLRLILHLGVFLCTQSLVAQVAYTPEQITGLLAGQSISTKSSSYTKVKGTPYLNEYWLKGSIRTKKGGFEGLYLRLNTQNHQLEFQLSKSAFVFGNEVIPSFSLESENGSFEFIYIRVDTLEGSAGKDGFYHLLKTNDSGNKLLGFYTTKLRKAEKGPYSSNTEFDTFKKNVTYYLLSKGALRKFKLNEKNAQKEFQMSKESILTKVKYTGAIE